MAKIVAPRGRHRTIRSGMANGAMVGYGTPRAPRRAGRALASCALILCLTGCAASRDGRFGILSGVIAWSSQNWPLSASSFLEVADSGDSGVSRDYAIYGLSSTYVAQDEYDSALARLSSISDSTSSEIRAGVWYQAGIIAFRRGQYGDAVAYFRKSLENDPLALDAKVNLELSHRSFVEAETRRSGSSSGVSENLGQSDEAEAIFNLVRKKEQDRWKNESDAPSARAALDY